MKTLLFTLFSISAFSQTTQFSGNVQFQQTATFTWHTVYSSQIAGLAGYVYCDPTATTPQVLGGGACADAAPAFTNAIASASCTNPMWVIVESGYGIGSAGVTIPHGAGKGCVVFEGLGRKTGFIALKGAGVNVVTNGYAFNPSTTDTQSQNIQLRHLTINGYAGTSCGTAGTCNSNSTTKCNTGSTQVACTMDAGSLQAIRLYNVSNLHLDDVQIMNSPTFAFVCGNCSYVYMENFLVDQTAGGGQNTDGIHFSGATFNVHLKNGVIIGTGDDSICICAAEAAGGNWDAFEASDIFLSNAYDIGRIYTWCSVVQGCATATAWSGGTATFRNITGTVSAWAFNFSGTVGSPQTTDTSGTVRLENIDLSPGATGTSQSWGNFSGKWKEFSCTNCKWSAPLNTLPMFNIGKNIDNNVAISLMKLRDTGIYRTAAGNSVQGELVQLSANSASIGRLICDNCYVSDQPGAGPYSAVGAIVDVPSGSSVGSLEVLSGTSALRNISSLYTSGSGARITTILGTLTRGIGAQWGAKGGATLTTGMTQYLTMPNAACTITKWMATVDTGTITLDIWKIATGTAIPTVANTIVASAPPAVSSATAASSTAVTTWTGYTTGGNVPGVPVAAYDLFGFNISALTGSPTTASVVLECVQ